MAEIYREFSEFDKNALKIIRKNVELYINNSSLFDDKAGCLILDIAPQDYIGAKKFFKNAIIKTLDINPDSGADFICDLCNKNSNIISDNFFDTVICTEVLEHTKNPFNAVNEIYRILKPGGNVLVTTPYNLRVHGPSPDCWRFTEDGLKILFENFSKVLIKEQETEGRRNMPIQYILFASK